MSAILSMSSFIFPLITFPYVSRILLPVGTGKVSFATSLVSYFALFSQLGIPTYGIRACAKVRDNRRELTRVTQELLIINLVMSVFAYIVFFLALAFVPRLREDRLLYIIVSVTMLLNAVGMEWLYKALEQYSYITMRSVFFKFIAVILMFLLVQEQSDYVIYGGITVFASSASNILNLFNVRKYVDMKPVGGYNFKRHLKAIGIFFAMSCATTIYTHLDTVMLGFMTSDTDVGYYNAAVRIKSVLVSVVTALGTVLLPRSSYYISKGMKDEFKRITAKAMQFVWILATALMLFFMIYAKEGIYFLSGDNYTGSIVPMQIIMPTLLLVGISNITGIQILVPLGKEKWVLYSEIGGAITDLILNAILIPQMQSSGAAIGTLAAELVVLLIQVYALREDAGQLFGSIKYWKLILGLALASAASVWTKSIHFLDNITWNSFCILAVAAILFFGVYLIVLTLTKTQLVLEIEQQLLAKLKRKLG